MGIQKVIPFPVRRTLSPQKIPETMVDVGDETTYFLEPYNGMFNIGK